MPERSSNDYDTDAIARRLKVVRYHVAGDNQSEFARKLGIGQSRWNNFERGYPINLRICALLRKAVPGLSIDWIVDGIGDNMRPKLLDQLSAVEAELFPSKGSPSSRKR